MVHGQQHLLSGMLMVGTKSLLLTYLRKRLKTHTNKQKMPELWHFLLK